MRRRANASAPIWAAIDKGVVRRLEKIAAAHATAEKAAKAQELPEAPLAAALRNIEGKWNTERSKIEDAPYVLIKEPGSLAAREKPKAAPEPEPEPE